ncbi:MAG: peptide chain release factor N(5)-glutamine methyltransferase [Bacilli bacterium]|jgi:release factor glutamine methyltransferase
MATNREVFLDTKKNDSKRRSLHLNDTEIYELLINANGFKDYTELVSNFDAEIKNKPLYTRNLTRLYDGEPLQYVLGVASFVGLDIKINHNVLIPRPETEGLALLVKEYIVQYNLNHETMADVCTGSGCIALYLKSQFKDSTIYASDKYEDPLLVAKRNKENLGLNIILLKGSRLQPFEEKNIMIDVLVSNPPYVEKIKEIDDNVLRYEPLNAIYSLDGLHFYDSYFRHYKDVMGEKFFMAFEINYDQKGKLTKLIKQYFDLNNTQYIFKRDIYGKERYLLIFGGYHLENLE